MPPDSSPPNRRRGVKWPKALAISDPTAAMQSAAFPFKRENSVFGSENCETAYHSYLCADSKQRIAQMIVTFCESSTLTIDAVTKNNENPTFAEKYTKFLFSSIDDYFWGLVSEFSVFRSVFRALKFISADFSVLDVFGAFVPVALCALFGVIIQSYNHGIIQLGCLVLMGDWKWVRGEGGRAYTLQYFFLDLVLL